MREKLAGNNNSYMYWAKCQEKSSKKDVSNKNLVSSDILTMTSVIYVNSSSDSEEEVKALIWQRQRLVGVEKYSCIFNRFCAMVCAFSVCVRAYMCAIVFVCVYITNCVYEYFRAAFIVAHAYRCTSSSRHEHTCTFSAVSVATSCAQITALGTNKQKC